VPAKAGDHIVAARALFGSCRWVVETLAPKYGIECTLVDGTRLANWEKAIKPNTKVFFLESPTNPTLEVVDIAGVAKLANQIGARLVVDNVFATPLFQKPLELGAHVVVYSATKHIDGQGRCLGGVILSDKNGSTSTCTTISATPARPVAVQRLDAAEGPETLPLRVASRRRMPADRRLPGRAEPEGRPVIYPGRKDHPQADIVAKQMTGGSTLICFDVKGGKEAAFKLQNALEVVTDLQQSRRCQEPDHPSGDDDAQEPDGRGARRTRHRAGRMSRSPRGLRQGACAGERLRKLNIGRIDGSGRRCHAR
jgi:O-succinylhomoserine sulfhydrylase